MTKYPEIEVVFSEKDQNAYSLMGIVSRALRAAGKSSKEVEEFIDLATSKDYSFLLQTCKDYVVVK